MNRAKQPHILLVDDDELNRRMMGLLLSDQGYSYETASNGVEAVEAVQSQQFDLVLMDLQMPVLDGFEATQKIRAWENEDQHIPIVALTAMLFENEVELCLDAGMDDCVAKPFDTKKLISMVETLVNPSKKNDSSDSDEPVFGSATRLLDIENALPRFGNDFEHYREFINEFIDLLPEKLDGFRTAFESDDFETLSKQAHNLKGVSASLGAMQISNLAHDLDERSPNKDLEAIQELLTELESNVSIFIEESLKELSVYRQNDVDTNRIL